MDVCTLQSKSLGLVQFKESLFTPKFYIYAKNFKLRFSTCQKIVGFYMKANLQPRSIHHI